MKIKAILFLCLINSITLYSQKVTIEGKMDKKYDNLYYSFDKMIFSPNKSLNVIGQDYSIELNLKDIKKVKKIFISNSLWKEDSPDRKEDCVHMINLKGIMKNFTAKNYSEVNIENDIVRNPNCGISMEKELPKELNKFLGEYVLTVNGDKRNTKITAQKMESTFEKVNSKLMTNENSNWSYSNETKQLTFSRVMQYNPELGLKLIIFNNYVFNVIENDGKLIFKSNDSNYHLEKL